MELWDIYDAKKKPTGRTMKRNDWCLKDGEYHLTVLGVITRPDGKYLITKSSIAGMGMNFQNAHNMTFFGLNYSYEKYYQAVRRMYRFGQTNEVNVNIIVADNEVNILNTIHRKKEQHDTMKREMQNAIIGAKKAKQLTMNKTQKVTLPSFML